MACTFGSWLFAVEFFLRAGGGEAPDGFHLLAAVLGAHGGVVKGVFAEGVFGGPEEGFGAVGEVAAGEVGGRVGFFPDDVVEDFEAELLHGEADGVDDVVGAGDPEGAVGFEGALAAFEPGTVEFVVEFGALGFVPLAFVDADHAAGVAGDAAVGEEVGRVGEDGVEAAGGEAGVEGVEDFEAVALVEPDAGGVVAVGEVEGLEGVFVEGEVGERVG